MSLSHIFYFFSICFLAFESCVSALDLSPSTLRITGESKLLIPADAFTITLTVITEAPEARKALSDNTSKINAIFYNLKKIGVEEGEMQTSQFTLSPIYSRVSKDTLQENVTEEIQGYRVVNSILIHSIKFSQVGQMIDTANNAGANSIDNFQFTLKNPREQHLKAIKMATENAIEEAQTLASGAGVELSKIRSLYLEPSSHYPLFKAAPLSAASNRTTIEQGDVEVKASVTIEFEIEAIPFSSKRTE